MRPIVLIGTVVSVAVIWLAAGVASAGEAKRECALAAQWSVPAAAGPTQCATRVALSDQASPLAAVLQAMMDPKDSEITGFCGQCTKDEDCGVGFKCAGLPDCMECTESP